MSDQEDRYARGLEIRRAVLGAEHVDRSLNSATDFSRPMQEFVTDYCWDAVWGREGLDRKTRSMINIALLSALNRQTELASHVAGALRNGCTTEEIAEVLIHTAVYCGVPSGMEGFRTAEAAINAFKAQSSGATPASP